MKLLLCADVRLGAVCTENLGVKLSHKWQAARAEKLGRLIDQAAQRNASYVALVGRMFGQERVSESVIDSLFQAVKEDPQIQVLALLSSDEYSRITYRNDLPGNLHLLHMQAADGFRDDQIALRTEQGAAELKLPDHDPVWIKQNGEGRFVLSGAGKERAVPSFEPTGFEDAEGAKAGYAVLEWVDGARTSVSLVEDQTYAYQSAQVKILPEDGQKDILRKLNAAVARLDRDTFLRITLVGRSAFGLMFNSDALKAQLQSKVFFVEVYDQTIMDIDEEAFENDISLRSEFVRLALQDDSLSESERNRLIACGWNALNGQEVTAE